MGPPLKVVKAISASGLTIYDSLDARPELYIDTRALERILNQTLMGLNLNYPIRTRSKVLKSSVCQALGYPVPKSFRKTQPRFPAQNFDTYVQKSDNLQIWNEEVASSRRYVLIRVDDNQAVTRVKVVTGDVVAKLDPTGTLTTKYQARSRAPVAESRLVSSADTANVAKTFPGRCCQFESCTRTCIRSLAQRSSIPASTRNEIAARRSMKQCASV